MKHTHTHTLAAALAVAVVLAMADASQAAVIYNGNFTSTTQIRTASNDPFFTDAGMVQVDVAGVNFYSSEEVEGEHVPSPSIGTVNGVGFDDVDFWVSTRNGPFYLAANGTGPELRITWDIAKFDERHQIFVATGPDAANLTAVATQMFFMNEDRSMTMSFSDVALAGDNLYVQILGGDAGWEGTIAVESNSAFVGDWSAADLVWDTASLFAFDTTADSNGDLTVTLTSNDDWTGVSGIIVSREAAIPEPATMSLLAIGGLAALLRRRRK